MEKSFKRKCIEFFARRGQKLDALAANNYTVLMLIHWTWPATLVSIPAYFVSYNIMRNYYMGTIYDDPSIALMPGLLGAVIVWTAVWIIDTIICFCCKSILKNEAKQEKQRSQKAKSERGRKIKFCRECIANGVTDISDVYDQKKAELIAQRLGYQYDDIVQFYKEAEAATLEQCYEEAEITASKNNQKR